MKTSAGLQPPDIPTTSFMKRLHETCMIPYRILRLISFLNRLKGISPTQEHDERFAVELLSPPKALT